MKSLTTKSPVLHTISIRALALLILALGLLPGASAVQAQNIYGVDTGTGLSNNSIFLRVNPNSGGEISALLYPYNDGDNINVGTNDHFGNSDDGGVGADFDDCAGAKFATRWDPDNGGERQWGSGWNDDGSCNLGNDTLGTNGEFTQSGQTTTGPQMTPGTESTYESVVVTDLSADGGNLLVTQKVIIRDNRQWFAVVYYLTNNSGANFNQGIPGSPEGISLMQGAGPRLQNSEGDDTVTYAGGGTDSVYFRNAANDFYVAFSGGPGDARRDIDGTNSANSRDDVWEGARDGSPDNNTNQRSGYVTGLQRYNPGPLNNGETHVVTFIYAVGGSQGEVQGYIDAGLNRRFDVGIESIDSPADMASFATNATITIDSTAAIYGLIDQSNVDVRYTVTRSDMGAAGCSLPTASLVGQVASLTIPSQETTAAPQIMWDTTGCLSGDYDITVCTDLGSDQQTGNDCRSITVTLVPPNNPGIGSITSPSSGTDYDAGDILSATAEAEFYGSTGTFSNVPVEATITRVSAGGSGCSLPSNFQFATVTVSDSMTPVSVSPDYTFDTTGCVDGGYRLDICTNEPGDAEPANDCQSVIFTIGGTIDVGVLRITTPTNGASVIEGSTIEINSRLRNYGETDQTVDVYLTITRPDGMPAGCTLPTNQVGSSSVALTLPGNAIADAPAFAWDTDNPSQCNTGNYLITLCTALPDDGFSSNDCKSASVNLIPDGQAFFINGVEKDPPPPVANSSMLVAIEPGTMDTNNGGGGEIGTILFPFDDGDTPSQAQDHLGDVGDNVAWELDDCAGGKFAVRWDPAGGQNDLQWGSNACIGDLGADGVFNNTSQQITTQNTTPGGEIESVIVTRLDAPETNYELSVVQKTIIRENNQWFATVYYVTNESAVNFDDGLANGGGNGVALLQGVDYNFNGSFNNDDAFYDGANDTVFGVDQDAVAPNIAYGGFSAGTDTPSNAHGVDFYITMWNALQANDLGALNQTSFGGDASGALRWNLGTLAPGETAVLPVIWGIGIDQAGMQAQIDAGLGVRFDAGVESLSSVVNGETYITGDMVEIGATAALFGVVDAIGLPVDITISRQGGGDGCATALPSGASMGTVDLEVPVPERAEVAPYFWDTTDCADGDYDIDVCTNMTFPQNDQIPANDCVSYTVSLVDLVIRLQPNQELQVARPYPNSADYPIVLENQGPTQCVSFDAGSSSQGWGTQLLDASATTLIAEDSDGDGTWDFIDGAYDGACAASGNPSVMIADGTSMTVTDSYTVRKNVPKFALLGVTDSTTVTAVPAISASDSATFLTSSEPPPTEVKTLHLHATVGAVTRGMDTFPDTDADGTSTTIPSLSVRFFQQEPEFQTDFEIAGGATDVTAALYIGTNNTTSLVSLSLFATDGVSSISIGSDARSINQPNNPTTPTLFTFTINDNVTIPAGFGISLEVRNLSTNTVGVWHDNTPSETDFGSTGNCSDMFTSMVTGDANVCPGSSQIVFRTPTYVDVSVQNAYDAPFDTMIPGGGGNTPYTFDPTGTADGVWLRGYIEDPFGKADIGGGLLSLEDARISVWGSEPAMPSGPDDYGAPLVDSSGNPITDVVMPMVYDDPGDNAGYWYEMALPLQSRDPGAYTVCINANESNGVQTGCTFQFAISSAAAVELLSFDARGYSDEVHVSWTTGQEIGTHGYNIYRSTRPTSGFVQINSELISGLGYSDLGGAYLFADDFIESGQTYYYLLEEVELGGSTHTFGPVEAYTHSDREAPEVSSDYLTNPVFPDSVPPEWVVGDGMDGVVAGSGQVVVGRTENEDGSLGLDIEIDVPEAAWSSIEIDGTLYDVVDIAGYSQMGAGGEPSLPVTSFLVDVPPEMSFLWDVVSVTSTTARSVRIVPSAPPVLPEGELNDAQDLPTGDVDPIEDPAIYDGTQIVPGLWADIEPGPSLPGGETLRVSVYPVQYDPDLNEAGVASHMSLHVDLMPDEARAPTDPSEAMEAHWAIASGKAAKLLVTERGIQQVSGAQLAGAGLDLSVNSANLQIFYHGEQIPVAVFDGADGSIDAGDVIEFYGEPADTEYTRTAVYWAVMGAEPGLRPETLDLNPGGALPAPEEAVHLSKARVGEENYYFSTLNAPGAPHWFHSLASAPGGSAMTTVELDLVDLVQNADDLAVVGYELRGSTSYKDIHPDQHVRVYLNGNPIDEVWFDGQERFSRRVPVDASLLVEGANTVTLEAINDVDGDGSRVTFFVRHVEIFYPRAFEAVLDTLRFAPKAEGAYSVTGFQSADVRVYDVADPRELAQGQNVGIVDQGGSYDLQVGLSAPSDPASRTLLAVTDSSVKVPVVEAFAGSTLADSENGADYLIVTHPDFEDAIAPLAALRTAQGLRVQTVSIDEVYDVFSFGELDPWALKELMKRAAGAWREPAPSYVLLVGDSTYDTLDRFSFTDPGQLKIPTVLFDNPQVRASSDNSAVLLDHDLVPDAGLGRIPAQSAEQVEAYVNKVLAYETLPFDADFTERVLLVADNATGQNRAFDFVFGRFIRGPLRDLVIKAGLEAQVISTPEPGSPGGSLSGGIVSQLRGDIAGALNEGVLLASYAGHGLSSLWADEQIFRKADIAQIDNAATYAVLAVFNCLNAVFADPFASSMGEELVLGENTGTIAMWGPTGFTMPNIQHAVGDAFYRAILEDGVVRLGDATRAAFAAAAGDPGLVDVVHTWVLLGDPALRLKINHPPVIDIIEPQTRMARVGMSFDASGTRDPNEDEIASYQWELMDAPEDAQVDLQGADTPVVTLNASEVGSYTLKLTVTDTLGAGAEQLHTFQVGSSPAGNSGCGLSGTSSPSLLAALLLPLLLLSLRRRERLRVRAKCLRR